MKSILRISTSGSVDDGKSTLIGRLLFDSNGLLRDQLNEAEVFQGNESNIVDLSRITDGLKEERENRITIDIAHRYFSTTKRKFILIDSPGHFQFTRNMVTGTSLADIGLLLIDVTKGVTEQTLRHLFITSLLGLQHIIVCINKMDLENYRIKPFLQIVSQIQVLTESNKISNISYLPISALIGDNIVTSSSNMEWYLGKPLLSILEDYPLSAQARIAKPARFPVQLVTQQYTNDTKLLSISGRLESGEFKVGEKVKVMSSGKGSIIKKIFLAQDELVALSAPYSGSLYLNDEIEIQRGDTLIHYDDFLQTSARLNVMLCWLKESPGKTHTTYLIKQNTLEAKCYIQGIKYIIDFQNEFKKIMNPVAMNVNDIGLVCINIDRTLLNESYYTNKNTGSVILIDPFTNDTIAAGMIQ